MITRDSRHEVVTTYLHEHELTVQHGLGQLSVALLGIPRPDGRGGLVPGIFVSQGRPKRASGSGPIVLNRQGGLIFEDGGQVTIQYDRFGNIRWPAGSEQTESDAFSRVHVSVGNDELQSKRFDQRQHTMTPPERRVVAQGDTVSWEPSHAAIDGHREDLVIQEVVARFFGVPGPLDADTRQAA